jgi:hypothetical protein
MSCSKEFFLNQTALDVIAKLKDDGTYVFVMKKGANWTMTL